jgi:ribosomal-protein-alanine N-acetyltransferase
VNGKFDQMNLSLRDMSNADLESVLLIEQQVHAHPWTRGNFSDVLASKYICKIAELEGGMIGFAVLMQGVDDAELLDIGIAAIKQRQGFGRKLLQAMLAVALQLGRQRLVLEVRVSNVAAIALYRSVGFVEIGLRRNYYPVENSGREDAILMGRNL